MGLLGETGKALERRRHSRYGLGGEKQGRKTCPWYPGRVKECGVSTQWGEILYN